MVSMERAQELLEELVQEIPGEYYIELNGGVNLSPAVRMSPAAQNDDLYIMGQYHKSSHLGRNLSQSITALLQRSTLHLSEGFWKKKLRETLRHELTHHLESLAGEKDLEIEDARKIAGYLNRNKR